MNRIYEFGNSEADIVLIQPVDDHDLEGIRNEFDYISDNCDKEFCLIAFKIEDWNEELSPWNAPAVFGNEDFGNGASETLNRILKICNDSSKTYYIGGYSLAGLFGLWAVYQTDVFKAVAGVSPSMWFPGFTDYMKENRMNADKVYLSLGDREEKTRNPIMATVGDRIREAHQLLKQCDISCTLEWNEGNHFREPDIRTAKGFLWLLNN